MAFNYGSTSSSKDANNTDYGNFELDAVFTKHIVPMFKDGAYRPQDPVKDDSFTLYDPAPSLTNDNERVAPEAPFNSPAVPKIHLSQVDLNAQDDTSTNIETLMQPAFSLEMAFQLQDEAYGVPSTVWNKSQRNSYLNNRAYNGNQSYPTQPFSSPPRPNRLDFSPPDNFNPFPTWGVGTSAFHLQPQVPQRGGSTPPSWSLRWSQPASPSPSPPDLPQSPSVTYESTAFVEPDSELQVESAPSELPKRSPQSKARRYRRAEAREAPYTAAKRGRRRKRTQPFTISAPSGSKLVHDCPPGYTPSGLPDSGITALAEVCPSINHCYVSDTHGCCVEGCPEQHVRYTRDGVWIHLKTHLAIKKALEMGFKCPFGDCTARALYESMRSLEKHIEDHHLDIQALCPFCLKSYTRPGNLSRHFPDCTTLNPA